MGWRFVGEGVGKLGPENRDTVVSALRAQIGWSSTDRKAATSWLKSIEYRTAVDDYVTAEVLPYVADAWVDYDRTKVGYEVSARAISKRVSWQS